MARVELGLGSRAVLPPHSHNSKLGCRVCQISTRLRLQGLCTLLVKKQAGQSCAPAADAATPPWPSIAVAIGGHCSRHWTLIERSALVQLNLWVRGFKDGTVDDALVAFKV